MCVWLMGIGSQGCPGSVSCILFLEVPCGPLVGLFNNKASLVCVYTKPPSVSPLLLSRSWLADNKHLSVLSDQGIYGFINVWFGDMLNNLPSGGHSELFSTLSTREIASDNKQFETTASGNVQGSVI